jgi:hypothetical protein
MSVKGSSSKKALLQVMGALGGRGGIAPTLSS